MQLQIVIILYFQILLCAVKVGSIMSEYVDFIVNIIRSTVCLRCGAGQAGFHVAGLFYAG